MVKRQWTDERVEALLMLWHQGLPTRKMGATLGVTKNSIAGIVFRLRNEGRICGRVEPKKPSLTREERLEQKRTNYAKRNCHRTIRPRTRKIIIMRKPEPIIPRTLPKVPKPETKGVTILARKGNECAYPIADRLFCGAAVCSMPDEFGNVLPTSWCEYHWIVCHKREPKGKAA